MDRYYKFYCKNNNCENENVSEHIHTEIDVKILMQNILILKYLIN